MKNINNINSRKKAGNKNILFLGVFLALFGAFAYANAQEQNQNQQDIDIVDGVQNEEFAPENMEAPAVSPLALEELQQDINRPIPSINQQSRMTQQQKDEATYFRNTSLDQARLASLRLQNAIDKEIMAGERERMKFLEEGGVLPGSELQQGNVANPNMGQPLQNQNQQVVVAEQEEEDEFVRPKLRGVYSYGDTTYAEMIIDGRKALVRDGSTLSNGGRVVKINPMEVTVSFKGKTHKILLEGESVAD